MKPMDKNKLLQRPRKAWHLLRRRLVTGDAVPSRLVVEKAVWLNDARSPVMLMVDDLTNAWHNQRGEDTWEPGGDWGGGFRRPGSALRFLEEKLLSSFPEIKVTFFTVAGPISAYTHDLPFTRAASLDDNEESRHFFRSLAQDPRFELAYHGYNHGAPGKTSKGFVQEWQRFPSVEAAVAQTKRGLEIFFRATDGIPGGGKYGGWQYNGFSEQAVNECGFVWWCRDWTPRDVAGRIADHYYDPQFFGDKFVIAIPSTVHGQFWDRRQIDVLLARRQVVSIAEHIAPVRPDGLIQTPNIVDDLAELRRLFKYVRGKGVWYATGSEIASYVCARELTLVHDVTRESFSLHYQGRIERPYLTLRVDCAALCARDRPLIEIVLPDGKTVDRAEFRFDRERYKHLATVPVMTGRYHVRCVE